MTLFAFLKVSIFRFTAVASETIAVFLVSDVQTISRGCEKLQPSCDIGAVSVYVEQEISEQKGILLAGASGAKLLGLLGAENNP